MILDIIIILFLVSAIYRGREIGFARQLLATAGFFVGLFFGAWLQPHLTHFATTQLDRSVLGIVISVGCALLFLVIGEYAGLHVKQKVLFRPINRADIILGGFLNVVTTLLGVWLLAVLAWCRASPWCR